MPSVAGPNVHVTNKDRFWIWLDGGDDVVTAYVNDAQVAQYTIFGPSAAALTNPYLRPGQNPAKIIVYNRRGPSSAYFRAGIEGASPNIDITWVTDGNANEGIVYEYFFNIILN